MTRPVATGGRRTAGQVNELNRALSSTRNKEMKARAEISPSHSIPGS